MCMVCVDKAMQSLVLIGKCGCMHGRFKLEQSSDLIGQHDCVGDLSLAVTGVIVAQLVPIYSN